MNHTESSIKVYYSKEYSQFHMMTGNRQLNDSKIKKIINDITNGTDVLRYCPIMVVENNGKLDIIDGQHRFWVSKKIKSPVWYIIAESMSLFDIAKMNSNTEKWKAKDFINCYSQLNNSSYQQLQDLLDQYPVPISSMINMLQNGTIQDGSGGSTKKAFERGDFKVNHYEFTKSLLISCGQFDLDFKYSRPFITAIYKVQQAKKVAVSDLIDKVNADSKQLPVQSDYKNYLSALENLFNKGKQKRVVIF